MILKNKKYDPLEEFSAEELRFLISKRLGGAEGARRLIRGDSDIQDKVPRWRKKNGIIYLSVTSDGTTGPEWKKRLLNKGFSLEYFGVDALDSPHFKPTNNVMTEVAIFPGTFFHESECHERHVFATAEKHDFSIPNAEVACLIREALCDKDLEDLGLWNVMTMHEPFPDCRSTLPYHCRLTSTRDKEGQCLTGYGSDRPKWAKGHGFAFAASIVKGK